MDVNKAKIAIPSAFESELGILNFSCGLQNQPVLCLQKHVTYLFREVLCKLDMPTNCPEEEAVGCVATKALKFFSGKPEIYSIGPNLIQVWNLE